MDGTTELLSISAFARRVGLAPSAPRFYDDCHILRPALVDGATGYRYSSLDQEPRARLVRSLREADENDYDTCVAAHYLARHQPTPQETSRWNQECLIRADRGSTPNAAFPIRSRPLSAGRSSCGPCQVRLWSRRAPPAT